MSFSLRRVVWLSALVALAGCAHAAHDYSDAERWAAHFENPQRDTWQKPDELVSRLALATNARVADIGAGTGYIAVRLARAVPDGRVWALDIEPAMVRYVAQRAMRQKQDNLFAVLALPDDPLLPEPVDLAIVVDTFHHIANRVAYFQYMRQWLQPGGRLVIVDFLPEELPVGPGPEMKLSAEAVTSELELSGYKLVEQLDFLLYQYVLVFEVAS